MGTMFNEAGWDRDKYFKSCGERVGMRTIILKVEGMKWG